MGSDLPELDRATFEERVTSCSPVALTPEAVEKLFVHYGELRRWNPRLSLIGPGTRDAVVERHYGESLAALPWIPPGRHRVLDIGSGAGFPGFVLACARPELEIILLEPRQRKWAFLQSACRKALLSCNCLNARVDSASPERLPGDVDFALVRALRLEGSQMEAVAAKMTRRGAFFLWVGRSDVPIPSGFCVGRESRLPAPGVGRILELHRSE